MSSTVTRHRRRPIDAAEARQLQTEGTIRRFAYHRHLHVSAVDVVARAAARQRCAVRTGLVPEQNPDALRMTEPPTQSIWLQINVHYYGVRLFRYDTNQAITYPPRP